MVRRLISLPCLTMFAWTLTLGWLIMDDRYNQFLAPKFKLLIYAGAALSLLFTLGAALQKPEQSQSHTVKGLVLILPILFILSAGDDTLDNFAMSKRGIAPVQTALSAPEPEAATPEPPAVISAPADIAAAPPEQTGAVSLSQLIQNWDDYDGKIVRVEGLLSETVVGHDELSAVFRYLITCCVADALPVGVFLDRASLDGLTGDDWVAASGRVRKRQMDGFEIIFMESADIEIKEKPSKNAVYIFN